MGAIKASPQVDERGNKTGNMLLEITYGGKEAPFGGIDASAPPMYIAPNCFVSSNGFIVSSEKLVAVGFFDAGLTLTGAGGATILAMGSFYANGQYNTFILGYQGSAHFPGPPGYTQTTYVIWAFPSGSTGSIAPAATLTTTAYDTTIGAIAATAKVVCSGGLATAGATITTHLVGPGGAVNVNTTVNIGDSPTTIMQNIAANIHSAALADFDATFNSLVIISAKVAGAAGNADTVSVSINNPSNVNPFVLQGFQGGSDGTTQSFGAALLPVQWVAIGETVYFGGYGDLILQFNIDPIAGPQFSVLTQYLGAISISKFGGFLIAGGIKPGPGTIIQAPEMVIAWSANGKFGIWYPTDANGFVTGAGFNQIADLSDYITGIFITNSIAVILHTQGIDYITLTGNSNPPLDFNHISNAKMGEGCQDPRLCTQYAETGIFVGNTDVFLFANGLHEVGAKIRQLLIPAASTPSTIILQTVCGQMPIDNTSIDTIALFHIGQAVYLYNLDDKTWMQLNYNGGTPLACDFLPANATVSPGASQAIQRIPTIITQNLTTIKVWQLLSFVQNVDFALSGVSAAQVVFPAEEIDFGRDVNIDGVYALLLGKPGQQFSFTVTSTLKGVVSTKVGVVTLGTEADGINFKHYKIYFPGTLIGKNPQLAINIAPSATGVKNPAQIAKAAMFGSFDPNQRPV